MRPRPGVLLALLLVAGLPAWARDEGPGEPSREPGAVVARGIFGVPERESLSVVDAFAWRDGSDGSGGAAIRVRLSDRPLDRAALERAIDFELELERQRAGAPYAELELDPRTAGWLDTSFELPDGRGCGGCGGGEPGRTRARLRIEGDRVRGILEVEGANAPDGPGVEVELALDVPIVRLEGVSPLPADGGEPARALELCRASVLSGHREGLRSFCLPPDDPQLARAADATGESWWEIALFGRDALRAFRLTVLGGLVKGGDRALLRVETHGAEGAQRGEVLLVRGPSGWRYETERLTPIWQD